MAVLFDHTDELDLEVSSSRSKFEIAFILWTWTGKRGGGGVIDMEQDGYESIVPDHDCDLWVTMVG